MRCLTPFLVTAVLGMIALTGYNAWQINELRAELAGVKTRVHRSDKQARNEKELGKLIEDTKRQTERARDLISKGQLDRARQELNKSLQKLEKASGMSKDIAEGAVRGVNGAVSDIKRTIDDISRSDDRRTKEDEPKSRK